MTDYCLACMSLMQLLDLRIDELEDLLNAIVEDLLELLSMHMSGE